MEREYQQYFKDVDMCDSIAQLSALKELVDDGAIRETLNTAVSCMKYLRAEVCVDRDYEESLAASADCVVKDCGPRGYFYTCSYCGESRQSPRLDLNIRGCVCGRVLNSVVLEPMSRAAMKPNDKLLLVKSILASMRPEELRDVISLYERGRSDE